MKKWLTVCKTIFQTTNWVKIAPHLVAVVVVVGTMFGKVFDDKDVLNVLIVLGGAIYTVICLFIQPEKKDKEGE